MCCWQRCQFETDDVYFLRSKEIISTLVNLYLYYEAVQYKYGFICNNEQNDTFSK